MKTDWDCGLGWRPLATEIYKSVSTPVLHNLRWKVDRVIEWQVLERIRENVYLEVW
jgi:hypothetical protein